jgi:hypothetical protein
MRGRIALIDREERAERVVARVPGLTGEGNRTADQRLVLFHLLRTAGKDDCQDGLGAFHDGTPAKP